MVACNQQQNKKVSLASYRSRKTNARTDGGATTIQRPVRARRYTEVHPRAPAPTSVLASILKCTHLRSSLPAPKAAVPVLPAVRPLSSRALVKGAACMVDVSPNVTQCHAVPPNVTQCDPVPAAPHGPTPLTPPGLRGCASVHFQHCQQSGCYVTICSLLLFTWGMLDMLLRGVTSEPTNIEKSKG
jgi:hypothetical protein